MDIELTNVTPIEPFTYQWPEGEPEPFERGWMIDALVDGRLVHLRHGLGHRYAYGRNRVRAVTWLAGAPRVEGAETDDYADSRALVSILRKANKQHLRPGDAVPDGYGGYHIVRHREEIEAPYSPGGLAVKIVEDDLTSWVRHALIRATTSVAPSPMGATASASAPVDLPEALPAIRNDLEFVPDGALIRRLLLHGGTLAPVEADSQVAFTGNPEADRLVHQDPFAFLLAVLFDQGIPAERAWEAPFLLMTRLGHLDPEQIVDSPNLVHEAVNRREPIALHRYVNTMPGWVVSAAQRVIERYQGDASRLWSDSPTAAALQERLQAFRGIGQKKAAMAVEILARDLHVPIRDMSGTEIAFDVHVRRVFLRTGLAIRDHPEHMVAMARLAHPEHPGALDYPAWDIGRRWCRPQDPDCAGCVIRVECPKHIHRADAVFGA